jgi:predicted nucleic acid-binding protein
MSTGLYGLIYTSSYIISETATLLLIRTNFNQQILDKFWSYIYGSKRFIRVLPWTAEIEKWTFDLYKSVNAQIKTKKEFRSFIDVSNIIYCQQNKIETIISFDGHFEGFLKQLQ